MGIRSTKGVFAGVMVAAFSAPVWAGSPLNGLVGAGNGYDEWTVGAGTIDGNAVSTGYIDTSAACADPDVTCTELSRDQGMLQERIVDNTTGKSYIQLILTDPLDSGTAATVSFASENYTTFFEEHDPLCQGPAAQDCQGIAAKQVIRDAVEGMDSLALIQRNFAKSLEANNEDKFNIYLEQNINKADAINGDVAYHFDYKDWRTWEFGGGDLKIGKRMNISSDIVTDGTAGTKERFVRHEAGGYAGRNNPPWLDQPVIAASGSLDVNGDTVADVTWTNTTSFGTTTTSATLANPLVVTWIGSTTGGNDVNYQAAYDGNESAQHMDLYGLSANAFNPFDWDPALGPAPTF